VSLIIETIKQFGGFGHGGKPDEYYYSQGMSKSRFGVSPGWKVELNASHQVESAVLPALDLVRWFTQGKSASTTYV
jgi:hypothetical protein